MALIRARQSQIHGDGLADGKRVSSILNSGREVRCGSEKGEFAMVDHQS